ncbi:MAG: phasin family protein [Candidatus Jettenia sp. CY-1]|nr:phasin family protein [Candidatus Jettenia sp.]WKZ20019.1 MAG: phasin family protein [Candidatus Jettenia sp. CY-1]
MKEEKIMISGIIKKAIDLAVGALFMTKENVDELIDDMVKNGEMKREEAKALVNEIMKKILSSKKEIESRTEVIVEKVLHKLDIPTRQELQQMQKRLEEIIKKWESKI